MGITIQIRKETKFKTQKASNQFKLDFEILDPEWASVYVNGKYMDLGTFSLNKDQLLLTEEVPRGTEIIVKDFERVGKTKRQKTMTKEKKT